MGQDRQCVDFAVSTASDSVAIRLNAEKDLADCLNSITERPDEFFDHTTPSSVAVAVIVLEPGASVL